MSAPLVIHDGPATLEQAAILDSAVIERQPALTPAQLAAVLAYREVSVRLLALEKEHLALKAEWTEALAAMNRTFTEGQ